MSHLHPRTFAVVLAVLTACYTVRTSAPAGSVTTFAAEGEACAEVSSKRVHYAIAGLIPINSNQVQVPGNARVRVVAETDALDTILRGLGVVFTLGLYGGTQSARVEVCQPVYVGGAPGTPPPVYAPPPPAPGPTIHVQVDPDALVGAAGALRARGGNGGGSSARRPARDTDQPMCKSGLDCEFGASCRDRGDGIKLCMHEGQNGDFCGNGLDCSFGLSCRVAGDGFKRCM